MSSNAQNIAGLIGDIASDSSRPADQRVKEIKFHLNDLRTAEGVTAELLEQVGQDLSYETDLREALNEVVRMKGEAGYGEGRPSGLSSALDSIFSRRRR